MKLKKARHEKSFLIKRFHGFMEIFFWGFHIFGKRKWVHGMWLYMICI